MVCVVGQAQYADGVLQGVVGVNPVCIGGSVCIARLGYIQVVIR